MSLPVTPCSPKRSSTPTTLEISVAGDAGALRAYIFVVRDPGPVQVGGCQGGTGERTQGGCGCHGKHCYSAKLAHIDIDTERIAVILGR